jgi:hypothetical protein
LSFLAQSSGLIDPVKQLDEVEVEFDPLRVRDTDPILVAVLPEDLRVVGWVPWLPHLGPVLSQAGD